MWPGDALPQRGNTKFQTFYASGTDWQAWQKPAGCSMVYIMMLAAGAGGSRVDNGIRSGAGNGGGSGGVSRMLIPAAFLPDTIYVQPGKGGLGATTANTIGGAGATSYVGIAPSTAAANLIFSQAGAAQAGDVRTASPAGVIGAIADATFSSLGLWFSVAGQAGAAGAGTTNGNGGSITPGSGGIITSGGCGGSNGSGSGGGINPATGFFPALITGTTGAKDGFQRSAIISPGLKSFPLIFTGGTGGAGVTTAIASGNGGNASYGGGGGGGGSGTNAGSTSGNGGDGGDGFIIIGTL
jgi:hypothetical protein